VNDRGFLAAYLLWSFAFTFAGLLALILPAEKYSELLGRLGAVRPPVTRRPDFQRRAVGLALAVMGAFCLKSALSATYSPSRGARPPEALPPASGNVGSAWLSFGIGAAISIAGLYLLIDPRPLVRWSQRLFPGRQIPERALRIWRFAFRLMGALMIYSSVDLFRLWMRR